MTFERNGRELHERLKEKKLRCWTPQHVGLVVSLTDRVDVVSDNAGAENPKMKCRCATIWPNKTAHRRIGVHIDFWPAERSALRASRAFSVAGEPGIEFKIP